MQDTALCADLDSDSRVACRSRVLFGRVLLGLLLLALVAGLLFLLLFLLFVQTSTVLVVLLGLAVKLTAEKQKENMRHGQSHVLAL